MREKHRTAEALPRARSGHAAEVHEGLDLPARGAGRPWQKGQAVAQSRQYPSAHESVLARLLGASIRLRPPTTLVCRLGVCARRHGQPAHGAARAPALLAGQPIREAEAVLAAARPAGVSAEFATPSLQVSPESQATFSTPGGLWELRCARKGRWIRADCPAKPALAASNRPPGGRDTKKARACRRFPTFSRASPRSSTRGSASSAWRPTPPRPAA